MSDMLSFNDGVWDENQWEQFLRENDRRMDRYMELMDRFMDEYPRPTDPNALDAWKAELRAFIARKGWTRDDIILPFLWLEDEDEPLNEEEQAWIEEMNAAVDDEHVEDGLDFQHLPIYQKAYTFAGDVLDWTDHLTGDVKDSTLVQFCNHVMQVPASIAKGHAFGYERDTIGGNIACAKRGLAEANAGLDLLRVMKRAPYMDARTYRRLYEQAFEVRNALGLYIQELRERFELGID